LKKDGKWKSENEKTGMGYPRLFSELCILKTYWAQVNLQFFEDMQGSERKDASRFERPDFSEGATTPG